MSINEFFQVHPMDNYGYGTGNGVFSVTFKPYKDLSISVGQTASQKITKTDSQFQIGDQVVGKSVKKGLKVRGQVIKILMSPDNKSYRIYVYNESRKKIVELIPATIKFVDAGNKGNIRPDLTNSMELDGNQQVGAAYNAGMQVYDPGDLGMGSLQ
jgi:hypothetical protein